MTIRLPKDEAKPLRRLVLANGAELVVELHERRVVFRYPRSRKPVAETTWGSLLLRVLGERAR